MDSSGENQTRVDTNQKEEADHKATTILEEDNNQSTLSVDNDSKSSNKTSDPAEAESSKDQSSTPNEENHSQSNSNQINNTVPGTEEIQSEKLKEDGKDKEEPKKWKTNRKKKNKADEDSTQWPTPNEARSKTTPVKKNNDTSAPRLSRRQERNSRYKKGINWKPLTDLSNPTAQDQQQGRASSSTGQASSSSSLSPNATASISGTSSTTGSTATTSTGPSGMSSNAYSGSRSGSGSRRRGGYRGGGAPASGPWRGSAPQGHGQDKEKAPAAGGNQSPSSTTSSTGTGDTNSSQTEAAATGGPAASDNTENPAAGTYNSESRRFRGPSSRGGRGGNRWRGGGASYGRGSYYGRYSAPRGGQVFSPLRVPPDPEQQKEQIKRQIEYYFGTDNLCKDLYLRKNMDQDGWLSTSMILNFNRVKDLNIDRQQLVDALKESTLVEVKEGGDSLRRREDWARWLFPPRTDVATTSAEAKKEGGATESVQ